MNAIDLAQLQNHVQRLEQLAAELGLDHYPVAFELVPHSFMTEVAVYGLPVRMAHWSFGVRYIQQLIRQSMGHSRIFEVMFPGDPCHAYLVQDNSVAENTLVVAHVIGHADFAKHNFLFARFLEMAGGQVLEQTAARARRIDAALEKHGQEKVEAVLDAALALEPHVDLDQPLYRPAYEKERCRTSLRAPDAGTQAFQERYQQLTGEVARPAEQAPALPLPPRAEFDLLWFIARHAPDLEDWERDIFLAVREESFYFYPVFACQIMNEGWASYWHARLLREADFLPTDLYLSAIKTHSDVIRPFAAEEQVALAVNPYHLGFAIWEKIIAEQGLEAARRIRNEEDDFGFIRKYLDAELAEQLELFAYEAHGDGGLRIADQGIHAVREAILAPRYNYGAPRIAATHIEVDGTLALWHDHRSDGRGLDLNQAERVLEYIARVWRRPVSVQTVGLSGHAKVVTSKRR